MSSNATLTRNKQPAATKQLAEQDEFTDESLCTVLYGYGKVSPASRSYLDDYVVEGGVIRNVPIATARHWKNGTRPDGKRPNGRVKILILKQDATEDDFLAACGLSADETRKLAMKFRGTDVQDIINQLGQEKARQLLEGLTRHFNQR